MNPTFQVILTHSLKTTALDKGTALAGPPLVTAGPWESCVLQIEPPLGGLVAQSTFATWSGVQVEPDSAPQLGGQEGQQPSQTNRDQTHQPYTLSSCLLSSSSRSETFDTPQTTFYLQRLSLRSTCSLYHSVQLPPSLRNTC